MKTNPGAVSRAPQLAAILGVEVSQLPQHPAFEALAHEADAALFEDGLLSLAGRMERTGREAVAARAYVEIRGEKAALAQRRLAALNGGGEIGDRAEVLVRQFGAQLFDPSTLFGLTVAGGAFRATRLAVGARLAAQPARLLTRGAPARGLAGLAGFSAEALSFPLSARFAATALGPGQGSLPPLSEDLQRSFLSLGALRLGGRAAQALAPNRRGPAELGMFLGLFSAHRMEERWGWRPPGPASLALVDSLALFAQFQAAGRIAGGIMGPNWARWNRALDARTTTLPLFHPEGWRPILAVQGTGSGSGLFPTTTSDMVPRSERPSSRPRPETVSGPAPAKQQELAEFKVEAGQLAHDVAGGMTTLIYNLPMVRSHLAELSLIQAALLKHYRMGGQEPPAEIVRQVDALFCTVCDKLPEPANLAAIERVEWRIERIREIVNADLNGMEARLGELIELSNEFRNLAMDRPSQIALARLDLALQESFLRAHLGTKVRLHSIIPERMFVAGPETTLRRIFQNLLVNTREALENQESPFVRVIGRSAFLTPEHLSQLQQPEHGFNPSAGQFWMLRIQDNGSGISPQLLPRIFESGVSTKSGLQGFGSPDLERGLGLAQVHRAVKARGGFVRVTSEPEQGATFEVYLPDVAF
ncbi:MAG TPA: HAMP domain-containing sensor histidine kinase [bacterium]|nr:HAMP domain-containing sensor histidine kinase [bacterium]